ncbi:MAG: 4Fe-4S dicluster domain-containing protein [Oligoflexia bacterium]|nr:4Fe-4S dicluster domain-containing protein [Oligoflexia bacterium]
MEKDILIKMQEDLGRAVRKPEEKRRWGMLIDLRKCVGCHGCSVSCMAENKLGPGVVYRPVFEYETGKYPNVGRTFLPRPCMQCDKPPCVTACPVGGPDGATWKETKGIGAGVVKIDYSKCIGCGKCVPACPYGARALDDGSFHSNGKKVKAQPNEAAPFFEYGKKWVREDMHQPSGNARKCHFCVHRLAEGMLPQCTTTCVGRATYFGDLNDSESEISKVMAANKGKLQVLKKNKGTEPRVFYIADENLGNLYGSEK